MSRETTQRPSVEKNLTWHRGAVSREELERRNRQRGAVVWFTGLSGAGKSTIAREVERRLFELGAHAYVLDGDNVRHGLNADLGFSPEDRKENIRRIAHVAQLFQDAGLIVLAAFISPYREDRQAARALVPEGRFFEVYIRADVETCAARDPKGLYRRALAGELLEFTGVSAPYEPPERPELVLDTKTMTLEACADAVLALLCEREILFGDAGPT